MTFNTSQPTEAWALHNLEERAADLELIVQAGEKAVYPVAEARRELEETYALIRKLRPPAN
jgi:hypothetical protein